MKEHLARGARAAPVGWHRVRARPEDGFDFRTGRPRGARQELRLAVEKRPEHHPAAVGRPDGVGVRGEGERQAGGHRARHERLQEDVERAQLRLEHGDGGGAIVGRHTHLPVVAPLRRGGPAGAVGFEPHQLARAGRRRGQQQQPGRGRDERSPAGRADVGGEGDGAAGRRTAVVEPLRQQGAAADVEQNRAGHERVPVGGPEIARRAAAVQPHHPPAVPAHGDVHEAARRPRRPRMLTVAGLQPGRGHRGAITQAGERAAGRRGEHQRAVVECGDAAAILRRSAISHLAPGAGDGLEPARREKGEGTPVGAPSRRAPAFGAGDRLGALGIQGAAPQLRAASRRRDEDHLVTGRREGGVEAVVSHAELSARRRSQ